MANGLMARDPAAKGGNPYPGAQMAPRMDMAEPEESGEMAMEGEPASPEEQAQYDAFVQAGYSLIYDQAMGKPGPDHKLLQRMMASGNPVEGLAAVASMVVMRIEDAANQAGQQISPDVLLHGGNELLGDLADLAGKAGVHDFTDEEIEAASYAAMDKYREARAQTGGGSIDPEAMKQEWAEIMQMNETGELDRMFPGMKEHFANANDNAQPQEDAQPPAGEQASAAEAPAPEDEEEMAPPRRGNGLMARGR